MELLYNIHMSNKLSKKDIRKQMDEIINKIYQLDEHLRMLDIEQATCELERKKLENALISLEHRIETKDYDGNA